MNAFALLIPGSLLIVVAALLLAFGQIGLGPALALIGVGSALEGAGVLLWARQRRAPKPPG